jgi:hypothetical protein
VGAAEPTQAIAMLAKSLAGDIAATAHHRSNGLCHVYHVYKILQPLAVCQRKNKQKKRFSPCGDMVVVVREYSLFDLSCRLQLACLLGRIRA